VDYFQLAKVLNIL